MDGQTDRDGWMDREINRAGVLLNCHLFSNFLRRCFPVTDQYIRIYDTTNEQFRLFKAIRARDVGWSVLDTAFRYVLTSVWSEM